MERHDRLLPDPDSPPDPRSPFMHLEVHPTYDLGDASARGNAMRRFSIFNRLIGIPRSGRRACMPSPMRLTPMPKSISTTPGSW